MKQESSEKDLIRKARDFDQEILAEIYDRFSPRIYRYAVRIVEDDSTAEECVAETFSRFLNALRKGGGPRSHLQAYLYRIAQNWLTDYFRQKPTLSLETEQTIKPDTENNPEAISDKTKLNEQVRDALLHLTPDQRQVIILKYMEGWSNAEVAKIMKKRVGAIKSLQHRALVSLTQILQVSEE